MGRALPVELFRSELDALPIQEATNLPYASTKHMTDQYGVQRPVMHACGHDMPSGRFRAHAFFQVSLEWRPDRALPT